MEPVTIALAKAGTEVADVLKKESESFLNIVLGEPAKALGGLLADRINARRHANLVEITVSAKRKLHDAGVSPKEVPLKIIHPMIEAAVLEEDPDLQTVWANLLANAADPRTLSPVSVTFPTILKELSSREVRFLNALQTHISVKAHRSFYEYQLQNLYIDAGLARGRSFHPDRENTVSSGDDIAADHRDFDYMMAIFKRHNLLADSIEPRILQDKYDARKNPHPRSDIDIEFDVSYSLSEIGVCFVAACTQPRGSA